MNLVPWVVSWAVLATVVLGLAVYRRIIASKEDDYIHVNTDVAAQQQSVAKKLDQIDKWGKILTIAVVAYALVVGGIIMYNGWTDTTIRIAE